MLIVLRDGYQAAGGSTPTRKEYQAGVKAEFYDRSKPGTVRIMFATNPEGERRQAFSIYVNPGNFEEVLREMMKADPAQAIRAIGTVLKDYDLAAAS